MRASFAHMLLQNRMPAVVAERTEALLDDCRADPRILFEPLRDRVPVRVELAGALAKNGPLRRLLEVLPNRLPAYLQMPFDPPDRPAFGPVEAVQIIDLFGIEHPFTVMRQARR